MTVEKKLPRGGFLSIVNRKCPLRGHILAPPEGLHGPGGTRGQPQESGGDSKAI